jgi:hypothetical protein
MTAKTWGSKLFLTLRPSKTILEVSNFNRRTAYMFQLVACIFFCTLGNILDDFQEYTSSSSLSHFASRCENSPFDRAILSVQNLFEKVRKYASNEGHREPFGCAITNQVHVFFLVGFFGTRNVQSGSDRPVPGLTQYFCHGPPTCSETPYPNFQPGLTGVKPMVPQVTCEN